MPNRFECHKTKNINFAFRVMSPYDGDRTDQHSNLHIAFFKYSMWIKIPPIIKPKLKWVDTSYIAQIEGANSLLCGYNQEIRRDYGFSLDSTALHLYYGIQPGSWTRDDPENSDHSKIFFIPWNETRRVRYELFDAGDGFLFASLKDLPGGRTDFEQIQAAVADVGKVKFAFNDCDGEEIIATCHISEMEWRYGIGLFKWVGYLRKPIFRRRLEIEFNKGVGHRKNDWKGGMTGTSFDMRPGESAEEAFIRFGTEDSEHPHARVKNYGFTNIRVWEPAI